MKVALKLPIRIILLVLGGFLSSYSLVHHFEVRILGTTDAICNVNNYLNCDKVALSAYSEVFGFPLGVFGLSYFVALLLAELLKRINVDRYKRLEFSIHAVQIAGLITTVILGSISTLIIKSLCLTCLGIYLCTAAYALMTVRIRWINPRNLTFNLRLNEKFILLIFPITVVTLFLSFGFSYRVGTKKLAARLIEDTYRSSKVGEIDLSKVLSPDKFVPQLVDRNFLATRPHSGSLNAKTVLVEFVDYQCPYCADFANTLKFLNAYFQDDLLIVVLNFPLDNACTGEPGESMHEGSCDLAKIALCAKEKGKFWDYYTYAFNSYIDPSSFAVFDSNFGLAEDQIKTCLKSKKFEEDIREDIRLGKEGGMGGTPGIFIDGKKYTGYRSPDALVKVIGVLAK